MVVTKPRTDDDVDDDKDNDDNNDMMNKRRVRKAMARSDAPGCFEY